MATSKNTSISGIYVILNTKNGKVYLGKARDIPSRWKDHRRSLNGGYHYNLYLQRAWNKYGEEAFKFCKLEYCPADRLDERERHHIAIYKARGLCYNIADGGDGGSGVKHSADTRARMSESKMGDKNPNFGKQPSEATRQRMSKATKGENNPNYGKRRSPEFCARMSEIKKGTKSSAETRAKMSEARKGEKNPRFGVTLSAETRAKISASEKGKVNSPEARAKMSASHKRRLKLDE